PVRTGRRLRNRHVRAFEAMRPGPDAERDIVVALLEHRVFIAVADPGRRLVGLDADHAVGARGEYHGRAKAHLVRDLYATGRPLQRAILPRAQRKKGKAGRYRMRRTHPQKRPRETRMHKIAPADS